MKAAKWRDLSDDEIQQRARELTEEVFNLRFQISMGVAKNPARVSQARRDLARAQTILRQRQDGASPTPLPAARARRKG
jgi:large subunit ribosomal protein L29